ncbi:MAG: peptidase E [Acidimicrobiia bacterium]
MTHHIVPIGGTARGGSDGALDEYLLELSGRDDPRVCFVPTASGDADAYITLFYERFPSTTCRPSHVTLFRPPALPPAELLADADIIYVGGGSTANMLAVWRLHGIDTMLRSAYERGAVLTGSSAGAICWFEDGITDSFGNELAALHDGLGYLAGSFCPHYDSEVQRRPVYRRLVADGAVPAGLAGEDGVAFHFDDGNLVEVVSSRPDAAGYQLEAVDGEAVEVRLPTRYLGT